jgi:hypothetical protein
MEEAWEAHKAKGLKILQARRAKEALVEEKNMRAAERSRILQVELHAKLPHATSSGRNGCTSLLGNN